MHFQRTNKLWFVMQVQEYLLRYTRNVEKNLNSANYTETFLLLELLKPE